MTSTNSIIQHFERKQGLNEPNLYRKRNLSLSYNQKTEIRNCHIRREFSTENFLLNHVFNSSKIHKDLNSIKI